MAVTLKAKWALISYTKSFGYTGSAQTWTAPYDGYYKIELWGAQGNAATQMYPSIPFTMGKGAYISGVMLYKKNSNLYVNVGYGGNNTMSPNQTTFNSGTATDEGWNGGGSTDVRISNRNWDDATSVRSRIAVAAGGGVGWDGGIASDGGGLFSSNAIPRSDRETIVGGATQTSVGSYSIATIWLDSAFGVANGGCSGGNGWYPGHGNWCADGTTGGSSYISGHTGAVGVTSTSDSSPKSGCTTGTTNKACSITPYINPATGSGYTFTNTVMIDGAGYAWTNTKGSLQQMPNPNGGYYASGVGHSGNGAARITYLGTSI